MTRILLLICCLIIALPSMASGETIEGHVKTAFIRDGFLWTKINGYEKKITKTPAQYSNTPEWSHDGKWILYQKDVQGSSNSNLDIQSEIWVYNIDNKKHKRIFYDGYNPKWSPTKNIVAFQNRGVLNISDLTKFYNVAMGVDDYNWYPDGKGFIVSSAAHLQPDGWTNPILYKIPIGDSLESLKLTETAKPLFVIPKDLSNGNASIMSINATSFKFSPDGKWISFIVNPTASWSMDSDMVCVISAEGKNFEVLDEMILHLDYPKWAPSTNRLAYIAGGGRIVFGFKNKKLKVTELPAIQSLNLTPPQFAEMGFTWVDNDSLIVSRVKETEWSNDPKKRPKPSLYLIHLQESKQKKITTSGKRFGDYEPQYLPAANKVIWKKRTLTGSVGDLWIANINGKDAEIWIKNVESYSIITK